MNATRNAPTDDSVGMYLREIAEAPRTSIRWMRLGNTLG